MIKVNGVNYFGFFENTPYGPATDRYEDYVSYKNSIDKAVVIQHIEKNATLRITSEPSRDRFSGETFNAGIYDDGAFSFTVDFVRYYKTQDIGIPYEYEEYLKTILK